MNAATKLELPQYLDFRMRPISEELAASGGENILVCYVPAAGHMKVLSAVPDALKAHYLKAMGMRLLEQADEIAKQLSSGNVASLPGLPVGAPRLG